MHVVFLEIIDNKKIKNGLFGVALCPGGGVSWTLWVFASHLTKKSAREMPLGTLML